MVRWAGWLLWLVALDMLPLTMHAMTFTKSSSVEALRHFFFFFFAAPCGRGGFCLYASISHVYIRRLPAAHARARRLHLSRPEVACRRGSFARWSRPRLHSRRPVYACRRGSFARGGRADCIGAGQNRRAHEDLWPSRLQLDSRSLCLLALLALLAFVAYLLAVLALLALLPLLAC